LRATSLQEQTLLKPAGAGTFSNWHPVGFPPVGVVPVGLVLVPGEVALVGLAVAMVVVEVVEVEVEVVGLAGVVGLVPWFG
jgi:hypothetical protein